MCQGQAAPCVTPLGSYHGSCPSSQGCWELSRGTHPSSIARLCKAFLPELPVGWSSFHLPAASWGRATFISHAWEGWGMACMAGQGCAASGALQGPKEPVLRGSNPMGHLLCLPPCVWDPLWGSVSQGAGGRCQTGEYRVGKGAGGLFGRVSQGGAMLVPLNSLLSLCYPRHWVSHAAPCQPLPPHARFAMAGSAQASPHCMQSPERGWRGGIFSEPSSSHS